MAGQEELVLDLADFSPELFERRVLSELTLLLAEEFLLTGGEVDIQRVVDLSHLLRSEVVVLFESVDPLSRAQEFLAQPAQNVVSLSSLGYNTSKLFCGGCNLFG